MRRVVVAGGAGFVGSHVCDALLERGDEVVCVDNLVSGDLRNIAHLDGHPRFTFLLHDVVEALALDGPVTAVLHMAAAASPADYARIPIATLQAGTAGTERLLQFALLREARFLLTSTSEVYGDALVHPQVESYWGNVNPIGPRSCYDESKRCAEAFVYAYQRARNADVRVARIFNTYGPRMRVNDGRAVPAFMTAALERRPFPVFGDGSQTRSMCYVDDLVRGLLLLLDSSWTQPVNLGNPHEVTMLEVATMIAGIAGVSRTFEYLPLPVDDPVRRCPDITVAKRELGWEPTVDLDGGLARTLEHWKTKLGQLTPLEPQPR